MKSFLNSYCTHILPPSLHVKDNQQKADHWGEGKKEKIIWRLVW